MTPNISSRAMQTQLARIREMTSSLLSGELTVKTRLESRDPNIQKDNYRHACQIKWGWEQLIKEIASLPSDMIDKTRYLKSAHEGLKRIETTLHNMQDQYFENEREYPLGAILEATGHRE